MFDTHLHCEYSGDSEEVPLSIINKAKELNLSGIIFTDHLDLDCKMEPHLFDLDIDSYTNTITNLIHEHSTSNFFIGLGIELGLQNHLKEKYEQIISNYDFDFVIGSLHGISGLDPYYDEFFDGYDISVKYHEYFEYVLENINTHSCFDTLGHLDYITRYGADYCLRKGLAVPENKDEELITEILKTLIKKDKSLEVNTAPFKYGFFEPNPTFDIIKKYKELGGKMITIGSDAHSKSNVGDRFLHVREKLNEIGFNSQIVYKKRIPNEYPLDIF